MITTITAKKSMSVFAAVFSLTVLYVGLMCECRAADGVSKPDSATATKTVAEGKNGRVYDLYIMSMCPYGTRALISMAELVGAFPQTELNVWFIGRVEGDRLSSLRGEPEIADEALWLAVKALYPLRYQDFLFERAVSQAQTEKLLTDMGFDVGKLRRWAGELGQGELRRHYLRSMQLSINASPTLIINDKVYEKQIGGGRLVRDECRAATAMPPFCAEYPDCFDDSDCRASGKIGSCVKDPAAQGKASCEFRDDVAFKLTALVADSAIVNPEKPFLESVAEILPGARVSVVKFSSSEGKKLSAKYAPDALPFFHFEKNVEKAFRFPSVAGALEEITIKGKMEGFRLKRGAIKENFFPLREERLGVIEIYVDPIAPDVGGVINVLLSNPSLAKRVTLRPLIYKISDDGQTQPIDKLRAEEAMRWLVLAEDFPKKYHQYLNLYAIDPGSTYWFKWLPHIGINQKFFMRKVEAYRHKITGYYENTSPIVSGGEQVFILINNKIKVAVYNYEELERVLGAINN